MASTTKPSKKEIIEEFWRRGNLYYKCHPVQREIYNTYYSATENSTLVWLLARQTGKTYLLAILALEAALRKPNSIVKVLTDTKIHMKNIFIPVMTEVMSDCPDSLKPEYLKAEYAYKFANGSQIQLAGSDGGNYERLRGQKSEAIFVDEGGFCSQLEDVVKSVLLPTTTHTGGKIVLASTPSADPDHDFNKFIEEADLNKTLTKKTIYDNPLLKQEQIDRIVREMGGVTSPKFRREYLCDLIRDEESVAFPEFDEKLMAKVVKEWPRPPFYEAYVAMDLGFHDLTAVVFAYYDYRADKVIIEDEIVINGKDIKIPDFSKSILDKEAKLWSDPYTGEVKKPALRVSDINYIVTNDMARSTGQQLIFQTPKKDDKKAAANNLRVMLAGEKIIIHPRCEVTIRHLKNCKWGKGTRADKFDRSPDDGHYDAADACVYLVRSINYRKNPYPAHYGLNMRREDMHIENPKKFNSTTTENIYKTIFGRNRRSNG